MLNVSRFKEEHRSLLDLFGEIVTSYSGRINLSSLKLKMNNFYSLWNKHEIDEEEDSVYGSFAVKKMLLNQHKQLIGHWKVLSLAMNSGNEDKIRTALDTDGRILFKKFQKHIEIEESFFDKIN